MKYILLCILVSINKLVFSRTFAIADEPDDKNNPPPNIEGSWGGTGSQVVRQPENKIRCHPSLRQ